MYRLWDLDRFGLHNLAAELRGVLQPERCHFLAGQILKTVCICIQKIQYTILVSCQGDHSARSRERGSPFIAL
jgi:hypothetical protein